MIRKLMHAAEEHSDRLRVIPAKRLSDLHAELNEFERSETLNGFQKWILSGKYRYDTPEWAKSVILVAAYHPLYGACEFHYNGKVHEVLALIDFNEEEISGYLSSLLCSQGYRLEPAADLPFKRLAVKCGLAKYGRNNITYIDGFGSNFSFAAFFTDLPAEQDDWLPVQTCEACKGCRICESACPTGALKPGTFLVDTDRCLPFYNETAGDSFPDWMDPGVHHTLFDCLRCQMACPMNRPYLPKDPRRFEFNEQETEELLSGKAAKEYSEEFLRRVKPLALFKWGAGLPRNLRAIFERE